MLNGIQHYTINIFFSYYFLNTCIKINSKLKKYLLCTYTYIGYVIDMNKLFDWHYHDLFIYLENLDDFMRLFLLYIENSFVLLFIYELFKLWTFKLDGQLSMIWFFLHTFMRFFKISISEKIINYKEIEWNLFVYV